MFYLLEKMHTKTLVVLCSLILSYISPTSIYAQTVKDTYDLAFIDKELNLLPQVQSSENLLILVVSSKDCVKCNINFNSILTNEKLAAIPKLIIADDFISAKNLNEDLEHPVKFVIEPELIKRLAPSSRSFLAIKRHNIQNVMNVLNINSLIINNIHTSFQMTKPCVDSFSFVDSLMSDYYLDRAVFGSNFLLFERKSQYWVTVIDKKVNYSKVGKLDSTWVYTLPARVDSNQFSLMASYQEMLKMSKSNKLPVLEVAKISFKDSTLCTSFVLNRFYVDKTKANNIGVFTTYFIGIKKVKSPADIQDATDLNTYDQIFFADLVTSKNKDYHISIFSPIKVLSPTEIFAKVTKFDLIKKESEFYGGAVIKLDMSKAKLTPISFDTKISPIDSLDSRTFYKDCEINISKNLEDKFTNLGTVLILTEPIIDPKNKTNN